MLLRVLTYNIHKGLFIGNQRSTIAEIKEALHHTDADIVFLQEISGDNKKKIHEIDQWEVPCQFEYLADQRWQHYAYGKNAAYNHGHHGNAILSKYPILDWQNIDISTNRFEKRGIIHAKIDLQEATIHCFCLHLNLLQKGRDIQVQTLINYIKENRLTDCPMIICGDFNDWKQKVTPILDEQIGFKEAYFHLNNKHAKTFPSFSPFLPLDRIYIKGIDIIECGPTDDIAWHRLSDHVGLHGTFKLIKVK